MKPFSNQHLALVYILHVTYTHLALIAGDEEEVEAKVVFALVVQALGVHAQAPLQLVVL